MIADKMIEQANYRHGCAYGLWWNEVSLRIQRYFWAVNCEGPPSFIWGKEGEGEEGWAKKWSTVFPVYSWHALSKRTQNIIPVYSWHTLSKHAQTQKLQRLALYAFIFIYYLFSSQHDIRTNIFNNKYKMPAAGRQQKVEHLVSK